MRKITNGKSISENQDYLGFLIDDFLTELRTDPYKNQQKILEVWHVGKFLMLFDKYFRIEKLNEEPDFIVSDNHTQIALEHQLVVDQELKEKEGFFYNLCVLAENELRGDKELPNFLANIYFHPYFKGKLKDKGSLVNEICFIVKHYVLKKELLENDFIDLIFLMEHTQISLYPNHGTYWQKEINEGILKKAILNKEMKIKKYISNT